MYIKNNVAALSYRIIFVLISAAGLILQFSNSFAYGKVLICYYTILSNILCFLYFVYLVLARPKKEKPLLKGAITMCITITGLVYHFMLSGGTMGSATGLSAQIISNYILHYIVPIMVILDYLLFFEKGKYKWFHPFVWLVIPYVYAAFIFIRAYFGEAIFMGFGPDSKPSRFPYPFVDVDLLGMNKVVLMIIGITFAFLILGFISYGIDKLLGKKLNNTEKAIKESL